MKKRKKSPSRKPVERPTQASRFISETYSEVPMKIAPLVERNMPSLFRAAWTFLRSHPELTLDDLCVTAELFDGFLEPPEDVDAPWRAYRLGKPVVAAKPDDCTGFCGMAIRVVLHMRDEQGHVLGAGEVVHDFDFVVAADFASPL